MITLLSCELPTKLPDYECTPMVTQSNHHEMFYVETEAFDDIYALGHEKGQLAFSGLFRPSLVASGWRCIVLRNRLWSP